MKSTYIHHPVLLHEVLDALQPKPFGVYVDATVGGGGHTAALLQSMQFSGHVIGIDADPSALQATRTHLESLFAKECGLTLLHGNFRDLQRLVRAQGIEQVDGILLDLGVSSPQFDIPERGFSFTHCGPLDMRFSPDQEVTAADLIAILDEQELADIIYRYGEERLSRHIARSIVEQRRKKPIETTKALADLVCRVVYRQEHKKVSQQRLSHHIHPATRTFQALRIAVNGELESLEVVLPQAVSLLKPQGRLAVISFHSLEDRIVKYFLRSESGYGRSEAPDKPVRVRILTKKPIEARDDEKRANPRSRSAKLRVAERIEEL